MKKRKMPPHIVLPNGQWRFVKRGTKTSKGKRRRMSMPKFRRGYRRHGGMALKSLMKGFIIGAVAGAVAPKVPMLNTLPAGAVGAGAGYLLGGRNVGAAAAGGVGAMVGVPYIAKYMGGAGTTATSGVKVYS